MTPLPAHFGQVSRFFAEVRPVPLQNGHLVGVFESRLLYIPEPPHCPQAA